MALPDYDPHQTHQPQTQKAFFKHPEEGHLEYEPSTMRILGRGAGRPAIKQPIKLPMKFQVPQPHVPTCSEPLQGRNWGCNKWAGCPFKALPYVGPGQVVMELNGTVSAVHCYDYYETIGDNGRPITNRHYGLEGWRIRTDRTTQDTLSYANVKQMADGRTVGTGQHVAEREVSDLLPPWWPEMKRKGLPLPPAAEQYPELTEEPCGEQQPSRPSRQSASRSGAGKRTTKRSRKKSLGTDSTNATSGSGF